MKRIPAPLMDLIFVVAMVAAISYLLAVFGPSLDEPVSPALSDAQAQAQRDLHRELAEARMCRELHGESLVRHTAAGETVCIPRGYIHRKNQIASNP